ncbi:regulatory protein TetR [Granulicella mallensis MP5ACTX8]|uniref:Regulatory protein TetR n=2 Tax=Granulicella mallensis TaxID=940614 RepID=G8NNQ1_GRAMM|nr:regulatory protein TetR [Granulicella mallensis MP5ACTX8]
MTETATAKLGRPRAFCEETALEAAMRVFWEKGYEGASLADLTEAMGINRASLYSSFGDKEALFRQALARYGEGPASYVKTALQEPTARRVVEALLKGVVDLLGNPKNPRGCLSTQGALATGLGAEPIKNVLIEWRKGAEVEMQKRFKRARTEGDLPEDVNAGDLTRYLSSVIYGLGIMAANGDTKADLNRVVDMTLRTLPLA